jgi:hypothetical protein
MIRALRAAVVLAACLAVATHTVARAEDTDSQPNDRKPLSQGQYLTQIAQLESLIAACKASAPACNVESSVQDVTVDDGGHVFNIRRDWLRSALTDAKNANDADRAESMAKVSARLQGDAAEVSAAGSAPSTADARSKADTILGRTEFRAVQENGYLQQQIATIAMFIDRLINGAARHLPHSPWLVLVIEWTLLGGAAVGLLIWAWRTTQQQRLALSTPSDAKQALWQKESDDWARRAETEASRGEWREAVHCLYWAAIVMLEGRRMWRANRARTPREYLPLLEAGSPRQTALGGLTRIFERIWYGLRPANRNDFERAQALLEELKAA